MKMLTYLTLTVILQSPVILFARISPLLLYLASFHLAFKIQYKWHLPKDAGSLGHASSGFRCPVLAIVTLYYIGLFMLPVSPTTLGRFSKSILLVPVPSTQKSWSK